MRGYCLIEPDIYEKLNWDIDLIVKCLEVIRMHMPQIIPEVTTATEYDLIAISNPHGPPYPAIGIYCHKKADWDNLPDWQEVNNLADRWVEQISINRLVEEAEAVNYINWEELMNRRTFPGREDST
jgi:hypothetical protein